MKIAACSKMFVNMWQIISLRKPEPMSLCCLQSFYRELSDQERKLADNGDFNFDHPSTFDFDLLESALKDLVDGKSIELPNWDVRLHKRVGTLEVNPADVILLEGILVLYPPAVRNMLNMKVYIDVDSDDRLARRVKSNSISKNPQPLEPLLHQYVRFVKRSHEDFVLPTKQYADIIVPRGMDNKPALKLMTDHIRSFLDGKDSYTVSEEKGQSVMIGSPHIAASEILGNKESQFRLLPK
ncbi:unnamed protein product [Umbelopsis sp. WA50703]